MQSRLGPNRAGPWGILQPIADAVKLIFKEELTPANADKLIFLLAPVITVVPAVIITAVVPWGPSLDILGYHRVRYRPGRLVVEQQVCHDGRAALHRPDDQL